jgi:Predicted AAA-ATPase
MRLPIGVQDFAKLREGNYTYVDKTMYFTELLQEGTFFFA